MKRKWATSLCVLYLGCMFLGLSVSRGEDSVVGTDSAQERECLPLTPVAETVIIDGVLSEACWKMNPPARVDYVNGKTGLLAAETGMTVQYAADKHYLYIGYETFDRNLVAIGNGERDGPAERLRDGVTILKEGIKVDVVEFFISFGSTRHLWEIHHNALNQFNDVWCTVLPEGDPDGSLTMFAWGIHFGNREFLQDDSVFTVATAVHLKSKADGTPSTVNDDSDVDTGYTAEIRIPWRALGIPRSLQVTRPNPEDPEKALAVEGSWRIEGMTIRLLAVLQNGDLSSRYHHSSPNSPGGWFHKTVPFWPMYRFNPPK